MTRQAAVICVLLCCAGASATLAREWCVDPTGGGDFTTIQSAMSDPRVTSGDSVLVLPGTYVENVVVPHHKNLTLRSRDGAAVTTIMPAEPEGSPLTVTVFVKSASTLTGFTVTAPPSTTEGEALGLSDVPLPGQAPVNSAAICLSGPAHVTNCVARGHRFGIISGCPSGATGQPPLVEYNEVFGNEIGISCCETTSIVRNNLVRDNTWIGILCSHSACGEIVNNLIIRNGDPAREDTAGILCHQCYHYQFHLNLDALIAYNTIDSNAGDGIRCVWEFGGLNQPTLLGNIISRNGGYGVYCLLDNTDPEWSHCMPRPVLRRCNLWGNELGPTFNVSRRTMCNELNPQFEDGYRLGPKSGCRDVGGQAPSQGSTLASGEADLGSMDLGFHYPLAAPVEPIELDGPSPGSAWRPGN